MHSEGKKGAQSKLGTRPQGVGLKRTAILALLGTLLVIGLTTGCAGVTSQASAQATNPPPQPQSHTISGIVAPASGGSGATVTLSGAATATVTADSSGNFAFGGLAPGTYLVTPSKSGFSFSPSSQNVTLTTADATAIDFSATAIQARSAVLTWAASATPVVGYDIYRSATDGGPYVLLNSAPVTGLSYTDTTVQTGETYFYVTTAVDSNGLQSAYSNQVQAVIP